MHKKKTYTHTYGRDAPRVAIQKNKNKFFSIRVSSFESFFNQNIFTFVVNVSERETKDDSARLSCVNINLRRLKCLQVTLCYQVLR
jgi:hypothetical protein